MSAGLPARNVTTNSRLGGVAGSSVEGVAFVYLLFDSYVEVLSKVLGSFWICHAAHLTGGIQIVLVKGWLDATTMY